jgi:tyrosinase
MALRKNQSTLSATEKKQFTDAVVALKAKGSTDNRYDPFVRMHYEDVAYGHFGPAFFAWHREFLMKFEQALQGITGQSIALPYWDWSLNQSATQRWPFTADFLGGNGQGSNWQVMDGPFAYSTGQWPLDTRSGQERYPYLRRQFGPSQQPQLSLPTFADVQAALRLTPYDVPPWGITSPSGFRNRAEGNAIPVQMHNLVHMWVGGSMVPMTSPNDPVFWLHHCYIDKMWTDWQKMHWDQAKYLPDGGAPIKGHNLRDPMHPWDTPNETVTPANVLTTWDHGYHYDTDGFLVAGEVLYPGQGIYSTYVPGQASFHLIYDNDGVLRLYSSTSQPPRWWSDNPPNSNNGRCTLESQGNLVIYGPDNKTKAWQSGSYVNNAPCYLAVRPDGYVSIYPPQGPPIWTRPS